ncbi:MAG TPA: hypothetical protein VK104_07060 [Burkholderiaceae bacterium]|nr:hypothetical protein [Burkholderiaceae bacterium]
MLHLFFLAQDSDVPLARTLHCNVSNAWRLLGACLALVILAGCASDYDTSRYHRSRENTQSDAHRQAQGKRGSMAPAQLQIGFGDSDREREAQDAETSEAAEATALSDGADTSAVPRPLRQAKTFLGTMPCLTADHDCPASRVTLTFSPGGEWRARSEILSESSQGEPLAQQGCWEVVSREPLRIILRTVNDSTRAALEFVNDSLLRVHRFNEVAPQLNYHLTRQPDVDPINELVNEPALRCRDH